MSVRSYNAGLVVLLFLFASAVSAKLFVPDLEPWSIWESSDESSTVVLEHASWQQLLDGYLLANTRDGINKFNYSAVSRDDRQKLDAYLTELSELDPRTLSRAEQQAYWINMYNALTVQVVLQHYPVKSIRKIFGGLLGTGPWDEELIVVNDQPLTLNDIEHRILRPIWRDNRVHYAVNCASMGCPNLSAQAFTAENTESLLAKGARNFINHPRGVQFVKGKLRLSSIFNWYDTDFGRNQKERLENLRQHADAELADQLTVYDGRIKYDYDWNLNEP